MPVSILGPVAVAVAVAAPDRVPEDNGRDLAILMLVDWLWVGTLA